jgi:lipid A ethanolaminephosphotransferase
MLFSLLRRPATPTASFPPEPSARSGGWHPATLILLASVWMASLGNLALWRQLAALPEVNQLRGLLFGLGFAVFVTAALVALLSLLAWRWTLKPALALFLLSAAGGAYFMLAYGVVIDPTMMVNVMQTDPREARDLMGWRLFATLGGLGLLPALWLWRRPVRPLGLLRRAGHNLALLLAALVVMSGALLLIFQDFSSVMRNHTQVRYLINPLNSFYAIGAVAARPFKRSNQVILPLGEDARLEPRTKRAPVVILVLGETARMGNFGINGYARPTTPRLAGENLASQRNAWSCGTSTAASVPCMFSHLGREAFEDRQANHEGLLDVLQRAGLAVLWINNQSGCKGVCDRTPHVSTTGLQVPGLCEKGECFDEIMLHQLDERIAELPAERRRRGVVVVMHQMGSHGPAYFKRTPAAFKKFLPECGSNALQECGREQVVNAYDNTILYTDHFLASTVQWLKKTEKTAPTAMVYVSDHGESLGENNLYLHGLPYRVAPDVQKRVPWITWLSPSFQQETGLATACLQKRVDEPISHDHYFHSVLGLMGVTTAVYRPELDIYRACLPR